MDRRTFLKSAPLGAIGLAAGATAARNETLPAPAIMTSSVRELVLSTPFPQRPGGLSDDAFRLARRIERAFEGRLRIRLETIRGGSVEALGRGMSDFHFATEQENVSHEPALATFAAPLSPSRTGDDDFAQWIEHGNGAALWDQCGAAFGVKPLLAARSGPAEGLWSRQPLTTLSGLTLAADGLGADIAKGLGADVVSASHDDIAAAFENGAIDAAEVASLEDAIASGISQWATCCLSPGLFRSGSPLALGVRLSFWEGLGDEGRQRLKAVTAAHYRDSVAGQRVNHGALKTLARDAQGVRFAAAGSALSAAITRVGEAVAADLASRSPLARKVNSDYFEFHVRAASGAS